MNLLQKLIEILDLQQDDDNTFLGNNLDIGSPRVYGGQVLAQGIVASYKTAPQNKRLHSLHGYFLDQGKIDIPIRYQVETIRDGRSFSVRRVTAFQGDRMIFIMAGSFQIEESGLEHQKSMPNVAHPDSLSSFPEMFEKFTEEMDFKPRGLFSEESPIIFHPVENYNPFEPGKLPPMGHVWFKTAGKLESDPVLHQALIAYASDFSLLLTALLPHNVSLFTTPMFMASLDHSMWFHRPWNPDEWMLYVLNSHNMGGARGFCTGRMYSIDGSLVSSVAQEGLIRLKTERKGN